MADNNQRAAAIILYGRAADPDCWWELVRAIAATIQEHCANIDCAYVDNGEADALAAPSLERQLLEAFSNKVANAARGERGLPPMPVDEYGPANVDEYAAAVWAWDNRDKGEAA